MKFSIQQSDILEGLKIVSRAVSTSNTLPVLGNVLIRAAGRKVHFSATNLELSIMTSVEANVQNEGALTVPAKILTSYVSLLPKEAELELAVTDGSTLQVKSNTSKTKIKGIAAEEFPEIKSVDVGIKMSIDTDKFRDGIHKVAFAAQENSSRPILSGVFLATNKKELRMAATDTYRLSEKVIELEQEVEPASCVIPVRAVLEADRLSGKEESVSLTIAENQIMITVGVTSLMSRLIDGQFPDYKRIIPAKAQTTAKIDRNALEMAVRRVSIFAKQNNQHMKLQLLSDGQLEIFTDSTEIGEEKTTIPVSITGATNQIALNSDYVLDVLSALSSEAEIQLELDSKMTPAVIKTTKESGFVHLIMPLKM
ncbi:DNA polymerase III subunit beta [bacterium DOLZORAL124_38_8]|nr:MAG: DNA polymerase III subunit beta [bacterium DOLZORAL124_38_8]